jgi:hypothetical protein
MYFCPASPIYKTDGVLDVSTPRYSASLSKSPKPSFLSDKVKRTDGFVASKAVRAYLAAVDASLSVVNKKRAACLFWNIFSTAPLSNGRISALTKRTRIVAKTIALNMFVVL